MKTHISLDDVDYETRLLAPSDLKLLQQLFEHAADYFELTTGAGPGPDEAQRAFVAGPPTRSVNDKRIVGLFRGGKLIGVIDSLMDWPENGWWTVGMLLLDPEYRGTGLGRELYERYEDWARAEGARRLRTAVAAEHEKGLRFLKKAGFAEENRIEYDAGARKTTVAFFVKELSAGS